MQSIAQAESEATSTRRLVRFFVASLALVGWLVYTAFWGAVRLFGDLTFTFGHWCECFRFFEMWIEPFVLAGVLGAILWLIIDLRREAAR